MKGKICDYGTCKNKAYKEVYPYLRQKGDWNYLCRKHFLQEQKRFKNRLPYANLEPEFSPVYNYKKK